MNEKNEKIERRKIYMPGDMINENVKVEKSLAIRVEKGKIYTNVIGIVNDVIIGVVYDKKPNVAFVDTGTAYTGLIMMKNIRNEIKQGDIITAKVLKIEGTDLILTDVRIIKKENAMLVNISPSKVARVIGREATMINKIKEKTNTNIFIGMNGYVIIQGNKVDTVIKVLNFIIERAHLEGLTNLVEKMLSS